MNPSIAQEKAQELYQSVTGKTLTREERYAKAVELAECFLIRANHLGTHQEKKQESLLKELLQTPQEKALLMKITDQCFRSKNPYRIINQLLFLLKKYASLLPYRPWRRMQITLFSWGAKFFPSFVAPRMQKEIRKQTAQVIIPAKGPLLDSLLHSSHRINLNLLGEAIQGEEEAEKRLQYHLDQLTKPEVHVISVKISSIFSQIHLLAFEESVEMIAEKLRRLYSFSNKWIQLDMEEYAHGELTIQAFQRALDDPAMLSTTAGIALQSYRPHAGEQQKRLTEWAKKRVAQGGAPIRIRLVKGANLSMEKVDASIHSWPQAPYLSKKDSDAQFFRMMEYALEPDHAHAVHIGIGSHNLFAIAYALLLRRERGLEKEVMIEMLSGMAPSQRKAIEEVAGDVLLYCPITFEEHFENAIGYLIRRLDENTAPDNFLTDLFRMTPDSLPWEKQKGQFFSALQAMDSVSQKPRRTQDRSQEPLYRSLEVPFNNEPDTDWSLAPNRKWIQQHLESRKKQPLPVIPLFIGEEKIASSERKGIDPSHPNQHAYTYALGTEDSIELLVATAKEAHTPWEATDVQDRAVLLSQVAHIFRKNRGELITAMVADGGKTVKEADTEVSEAIDFIAYYTRSFLEYHKLPDITFSTKGVVLVTPPWNFPCAIPTGGIAAALVTGNSVIFKPAPETILVGWTLAQCFWEAGISKENLCFFPCDDEPCGTKLIQHRDIATVILTGATETAKKMMQCRPGIDLIAETGGKNSLIATNLCDRDLVIRDLVQSTLGHAGQKCSACSLAILFNELYDDPHFLEQLRDAFASLPVGSAWDLRTRIPPLIRPPNPTLLRGIDRARKRRRVVAETATRTEQSPSMASRH